MAILGHFRIQAGLFRILSAQYRSSEDALKELVTNCWDADATEVAIELAIPLTQRPITIADNGRGMSVEGLQANFLQVAYDRRGSHEVTPERRRMVRGRLGIGKFAAFQLANHLRVTSVAGGVRSTLTLDLDALLASKELERVDLPIDVEDSGEHSGTTLELSDLKPEFALPSPKTLGGLLLREFGARPDFVIYIDGDQLTPSWVEARQFAINFPAPPAVAARGESVATAGDEHGPVEAVHGGAPTGTIWVANAPRELADSGLTLRVGERVIGAPGFFGLEHDPTVPRAVLRRISGEVRADHLAPFVLPAGDSIIESSAAFNDLSARVKEAIRERVAEILERPTEVETAETFVRAYEQQLELLPYLERDRARHALIRLFNRLGEESSDKKRVVAELVLNVFSQDPFWVVAQQLDRIDREDLNTLVDVLSDWGLGELAGVASHARARLRFLDAFEGLITAPDTREFPTLQRLIERNAWLIGDEYELWSANRTMQRIVRDLCGRTYDGSHGKRRPDLVLLGLQNRYLLIELKRPSEAITRTAIAQAEEYRDDLKAHIRNGSFRILVVGGKVERNLPSDDRTDIRVTTYDELLLTARERFNWLVQEVGDMSVVQEFLPM